MKPSLAASRAVAVLNYMMGRPLADLSQKQLAVALEINAASLSAVLAALTGAGYLVRHPEHKTFALGPTLVALGTAGGLRHPAIERARPEMRKLAALGTECFAVADIGAEQILLTAEGRPSQRANMIGQSFPISPPYGQIFLPWAPMKRIEAWYAKADPKENDWTLEKWIETFGEIRRRGFSVALESPSTAAVQSALAAATRHPGDQGLRRAAHALINAPREYVLGAIDPAAEYHPNYISAPIFDSDGLPRYALSVMGLPPMDGEELMRAGQMVEESCLAVTRGIGGRTPESVD